MSFICARADRGSSSGSALTLSAEEARFGTEEIGWRALGPAIACTLLATIAVALRWYTRWKISQCLGRDDVVILLSMVLGWAMCGIIGAEFNSGMGVFTGTRMIDAPHLAKLAVVNNDIWALAVNITKASILTQYLRIFSDRMTRTCCWLLMILLLPAAIWATFGGTFLCSPVEKLWSPEIEGHCLDPTAYWLSAAGVNIALDFLVLVLPLPGIAMLHLPRRQKICLLAVFILGFFVCVVSIVRLATVFDTSRRGKIVESGVLAITWSIVEADVGIICACLMSYKPLLAKHFPRLFEETATPEHSMRLPIMETLEDTGGARRLFAPQMPSLPSSPSTAKSRDTFGVPQRTSVTPSISGAPQTSGLSFVDMLESGPEAISRTAQR